MSRNVFTDRTLFLLSIKTKKTKTKTKPQSLLYFSKFRDFYFQHWKITSIRYPGANSKKKSKEKSIYILFDMNESGIVNIYKTYTHYSVSVYLNRDKQYNILSE